MFQTPLLLAGLALLVPVLIAFLVRRRDRFARVPSTLLFRNVALARIKNRRFKSWARILSLLACLIGVGGLIAAAADPTWFGRTRSIAVVVDVSASMGESDDDPLGRARIRLREIISQRRGRDRIAIIAAGDQPRHLAGPTTNSTLLYEALDEIRPERGQADLVGAVRLARGLMSGRRRAQIWLIDDGGVSAIEDQPSLDLPLYRQAYDEPRENVGITVLSARIPDDAEDETERELLVAVSSSATTRRVNVRLLADGTELDEREVTLTEGRGEMRFRLRVPASEVIAMVEPADGREDSIETDNLARLNLGDRRPIHAHLVVGQDDEAASFFVERALVAAGVEEVERHDPDRVPQGIADNEILVVLSEAPPHRIRAPTLFFSTRTGELPLRVQSELDGAEGEMRLRSIDSQHPLARGVELDEALIREAVAVEVPSGATEVIALDGGSVAAVGGAGRSRWVYVGVDPTGSDLVLRVAFPVLTANAVALLAGSTDIRIADTIPRAEVTLAASTIEWREADLQSAWPIPLSLAALVSMLAALLLLGEGYAHFRGWSK